MYVQSALFRLFSPQMYINNSQEIYMYIYICVYVCMYTEINIRELHPLS